MNYRRLAIGVAVLLTFLALDFMWFSIFPTEGLARFIRKVTLTTPPGSDITPLVFTKAIPPIVAQDRPTGPVPTPGPWAATRFASKHHLVVQIQLLVDYVVAYFIAVDIALARLPWFTANLVSITHFLVALCCGYCIYRAATAAERGELPGQLGHGYAPLPPAGADASGAPLSPCAAVAPAGCWTEAADGGGEEMHTVCTQRPPAASPGPLTLTSPVPPNPAAGAAHHAASAAVPVPDGQPCDEAARKAVAVGAVLRQSIHPVWLRRAAALLWLRNMLDTLDGVLARIYRRTDGFVPPPASAAPSAGGVSAPPPPPGPTPPQTTFGLNGHMLDVVVDTAGVMAVLGCTLYLLLHRGAVVGRLPSRVLHRLGAGGFNRGRPVVCAKLVALAGVAFIGIAGLVWETYMVRYVNLFDAHAPYDEALAALEASFHVRLSQYLLSLTAGDLVLIYYILAMLLNRVWDLTQALVFIGYPWLLLVTVHTVVVWSAVVEANPVAQRLIQAQKEADAKAGTAGAEAGMMFFFAAVIPVVLLALYKIAKVQPAPQPTFSGPAPHGVPVMAVLEPVVLVAKALPQKIATAAAAAAGEVSPVPASPITGPLPAARF